MAETKVPDIIYTIVDEAPELASASLLPVIKRFAAAANIHVKNGDISLASRILAKFSDTLTNQQRQNDDLSYLGAIVRTATANVIKLPNISASVSQLKSAISELQDHGYPLPDYPDTPQNEVERLVRDRYESLKGSAVNPILREGNSDRRAASAVKNYAMKNPHQMGMWSKKSDTHVVSMASQDFFSNESSAVIEDSQAGNFQIVFKREDGKTTVLKDELYITAGTLVDASYMSVSALRNFIAAEMVDAKARNILFSLHLKATMMKVSDPVIFGHVISVFLESFVRRNSDVLKQIGFNANLGLGDLEKRIESLPNSQKNELKFDLAEALAEHPKLYMVDSDLGITNLHVSSDVIIDASMPALIRAGGRAWGADGQEHDCKCVIPDSSYASLYDDTIAFFKENGALDPTSCGSVSNVGLMAQKAEEYGSHSTTFELCDKGTVRVLTSSGLILHEHDVEAGDIWRLAMTKRVAIEDWVQLGLARQKATGTKAVFWLDKARPHDAILIKYVEASLENAELDRTLVKIMSPSQATRFTLKTITAGEDCISITGNVLRDYLTDLFPILELGTSAKMLSIVKLMNGGGLFETGAGGSAPKHVQQLIKKGHLRWDSLGEFCALSESLMFAADLTQNVKAKILGKAANLATQDILTNNKSPQRGVGEIDTRDSHFYFALYWARAMSNQIDDLEMAAEFSKLAFALETHKAKILEELASTQGRACDLGGYYKPNLNLVNKIMRPSLTFNNIIG